MRKLSIIINDRNEYFSHWAAQFAPQWDGDDETFVSVPVFTKRYARARVYETRRSAERCLKKIWSSGKLDIVTLEVEEDPDASDWMYDYCFLHDCDFRSTELYPMCPHRNDPSKDPQLRPTNCIPDYVIVSEIMES